METNNNWMPRPILWVLGILLIVLVGVYAAGRLYSLSREVKQGQEPKKTISISAEGKVMAVPDLATVNLGVVTRGSSAADVQDQNSKKINQIIEFIKQQGISKDDIATTNYNIYPQYDYQNGRNIITGYMANQTVTVKVRGVDKSNEQLGKIIDGATNNGANEINGISLSFSDPDNFRQEARKQAIAKAKEKAQELAREAGLSLGRVVTVSESPNSSYPVPMMDYAMGRGGSAVEKSVSPNIEPGNQEITEQMTVVFELK